MLQFTRKLRLVYFKWYITYLFKTWAYWFRCYSDICDYSLCYYFHLSPRKHWPLVHGPPLRTGGPFLGAPGNYRARSTVLFFILDSSFKRFENCTVKLSAKEIKWTSLEVRTRPTFLENLISKYDFRGPLSCFVFHSRWEFQNFWKLYRNVFG